MATAKQIAGQSPQAEKSYSPKSVRAYQCASVELQKLQKKRRLAEIGFASQKRAKAEERRKSEKQGRPDRDRQSAQTTRRTETHFESQKEPETGFHSNGIPAIVHAASLFLFIY